MNQRYNVAIQAHRTDSLGRSQSVGIHHSLAMKVPVTMSTVRASSIDDGAAVRVEHLACVIGGILRCQEDIRSAAFEGLASACHGHCAGAPLGAFGLLSGEGSGDEGGPDRAWRYSIDANPPLDELQSESSCECQYRALCRGVVEEHRSALVGCD